MDTDEFATSKAVVHHMTRVMKTKCARQPNVGQILVNTTAPSVVPSKMSKDIAFATGSPFDEPAKDVPMERYDNGCDMIGLAIVLASKAPGCITGTVITLDGGQVGTADVDVGSAFYAGRP